MERFLLIFWLLSGWLILSLCLEHQYYFVENKLTWYQAQSYCRQHYTDLATIRNSEDMNHFLDVLSAQSSSDVWIGLYSEINWMWSNELEKRNPGYTNWEITDNDPDFISANQFCVCMGDNGRWWDYNCEAKFPFICFKGTPGGSKFVVINETMSWSEAQRYCRDNFIDLADIGNSTDNQQIQQLVPTGNWAWTGLYREENIYWSDQSSLSFTKWDHISNPIGSRGIICGATSEARLAKWRFLDCHTTRSFVCYRFREQVMRRRVKIKVKSDSSAILTDPNLQNKILRKLQEKLQENAPLKFVEQPDGKIFHKEKEKKRTEL